MDLNEGRNDGVAIMASAGPYANHMHFTPEK